MMTSAAIGSVFKCTFGPKAVRKDPPVEEPSEGLQQSAIEKGAKVGQGAGFAAAEIILQPRYFKERSIDD